MAGTTGARTLSSNLEKILVGLIFVSIIVAYFVSDDKDVKSSYAFVVVLGLEIVLAIYYSYLIRNLYSLFLVGFIIFNIGCLLPGDYYNLRINLKIAGFIAYACLGVFLAYKTVIESLRNKDLELFGTLISIGLLFPLFHHFYFPGNEDYLMIYHFALAFLLGTIIYNENLWDKYNNSEKKILTYVLISTIAEVLLISLKML